MQLRQSLNARVRKLQWRPTLNLRCLGVLLTAMLSVFRFFSITYLTKGNLTVSIKFRRLKKLEKYHEKTTTYWGTSGCCWTCWFLVAGGCGLSFAGSLEAGVAAFVGFEACCWLGLDFDGKSPILTSFRRRCNLHTVYNSARWNNSARSEVVMKCKSVFVGRHSSVTKSFVS